MNKFMRILVFFDLPVKTKQEKKVAANFRKFLLKDGYHMLQYSMYARTCNGNDAVEKHKKRLYVNLPDNGSVRALTITEKQYQSIEILVGALTKACDNPFETEQLTLF
jgi:CRISPR-associated protein Cas2